MKQEVRLNGWLAAVLVLGRLAPGRLLVAATPSPVTIHVFTQADPSGFVDTPVKTAR